MKRALSLDPMTAEQDQHISSAIERERRRLKNFIRKRVADESDVEDILQDVFYELVEAYRLMKPVGHISAWLFAVARNRIIDLFRKRKPVADEDASFRIEDMLPSRDAGPEAEYARTVLLEELDAALEELPEDQRAVFIAHEFEGRSFKEMAAESGVSVNTLLSRKHYAVRHLRKRLQAIYEDFMRG
jgi:RNA polymerase sigma factor (sigma-70 family)